MSTRVVERLGKPVHGAVVGGWEPPAESRGEMPRGVLPGNRMDRGCSLPRTLKGRKPQERSRTARTGGDFRSP